MYHLIATNMALPGVAPRIMNTSEDPKLLFNWAVEFMFLTPTATLEEAAFTRKPIKVTDAWAYWIVEGP